MSFVYTTAIEKLRKLTKRVRGVPGGTSAGKTYGILPIEIDYAARNPLTETSIVSESIPHIRRGALKDFENIMRNTNRWVEGHFNKSLLKYTFTNGSYIEFFSADQPDRLRGARRHRLFINECNNITFDAYQQMAIRTRDIIWLDFNPTHEFWYHRELKQDADFEEVVLTYKDNEALSDNIIKEIEKGRIKAETSEYWANWWRVYGLGELGILEGVIFNNYKIIDRVPEEARYVGTGLDFGYTNDPTAITDVYSYDNKRILDEVCYRTGMVNNDISAVLKGKGTVYADSAEPKSIEEIRRTGVDIRGASKGRDSINYGVSVMQGQDYLVTKRSTNLIKELRNYSWDTDKTGAKTNKPIDMFNHLIDGIRYHEMETVGLRNQVFIF